MMRVKNVNAAAYFVLAASVASGSPIVIVHEGSGGGTLDGVAFAADFTITAFADTDDRDAYDTVFSLDHSSANIEIAGLGTFDFISSTRTFVNNDTMTVGFSHTGEERLDLFNGPVDPVFADWDLNSSVGPIAGTGQTLQWERFDVMTSGGVLYFEEGFVDAVFTATIVPAPAVLPFVAIAAAVAPRRRGRVRG